MTIDYLYRVYTFLPVLEENISSLLPFDTVLCRQLLSLERYRRKKGVEVKV
jgi:hypothetical protein